METIKTILLYVQQNKKEFLKYCSKNWEWCFIHTKCGTTGWQATIKKSYCMSNPARGSELLVIGMAIQHKVKLHTLSESDVLRVLLRLHVRYSDRIQERYEKLSTKKIGWDITDEMHELIHRGYEIVRAPQAWDKITLVRLGETNLTIFSHKWDTHYIRGVILIGTK